MKIGDMQKTLAVEPIQKELYLMYCRKSSESEDRQVQSIDDQTNALQELNCKVDQDFIESTSAKSPGRSEFNKMVELLETGKYKGILAWNVSRLTRNPVDTGRLQWLLQTGKIQEIKTPHKTYTEVDSDFIMAIEGAQANRFIRDLTRDSQRGVNSKIDKGLAPLLAPPGYRNAVEMRQGEKEITPHPTYFNLMRKLFDLALTGNFTITQLRKESEKLGIRNTRDKFLSLTQMSVMLRNPFYCGKFVYAGRLYEGKHKPIISVDEFNYLQDLLDGRRTTTPKKLKFESPYKGLIKCSECGMSVTYSQRTKQYKNGKSQQFEYYKCTRKNKDIKCSQQPVKADVLDKAVEEMLQNMEISPRFVDWAKRLFENSQEYQKNVRNNRYEALQLAQKNVISQLDALLDIKIKDLISDDEYRLKKITLTDEKNRIESDLRQLDQHIESWMDLVVGSFEFASKARKKYQKGTVKEKTLILSTLSADLILKDRQLVISIQTPFKKITEAIYALEGKSTLRPTNTSPNQAKHVFTGTNVSKWVDDGSVLQPIKELKEYYASLSQIELNQFKQAFSFA